MKEGQGGLLVFITPHQDFLSMKIFIVKRSSTSMSVVHELFGQMVGKKKDKRLIAFTDFDIKISTFSRGLFLE